MSARRYAVAQAATLIDLGERFDADRFALSIAPTSTSVMTSPVAALESIGWGDVVTHRAVISSTGADRQLWLTGRKGVGLAGTRITSVTVDVPELPAVQHDDNGVRTAIVTVASAAERHAFRLCPDEHWTIRSSGDQPLVVQLDRRRRQLLLDDVTVKTHPIGVRCVVDPRT